MSNVYSYTLSKSKPLISSSALKYSQTLPVPGVPPPWTTRIKQNKGGSFRSYSEKISCLLIILIFGGGQQPKNLCITEKLWSGKCLLLSSCFAGENGAREEKENSDNFILANEISRAVRNIAKKKKILTFHKFPLWPILLLLPHQKFIKGISILYWMGPWGAIDLVGEKGYKYRIIHLMGRKGWRFSFKPTALSPGELTPDSRSSMARKWVKCVNFEIADLWHL